MSIIIQNLLVSFFVDRDKIGLLPCCWGETGFQTIPKYYREWFRDQNPFEAYELIAHMTMCFIRI